MQIFFRTNKLAKVCNNKSVAVKKLGKISAAKLMQRLSQINAADKLSVLMLPAMPGRCHKLKANRLNQYAMDLKHPCRLIFEPSNGTPGWKQENMIIENKVKEITIVEIKDYH